MKNFMKNILFVGLLVVAQTAFATDLVKTVTPAVATNVVTGAIHLTSLEVINNGSGSSMGVWIYDAPGTNTTFSLGAYTNYTTYTTNIVITTTNYNGVVETATNAATFTLANPVGSSTPSYRLIKSFLVATNGTATWAPVGGVYLSFGLMATNNVTNVTYNVSYSTLQ